MRILASFLLINAFSFAQTMTEFGAVAAGSTVGGASGKAVSNGINAIFGKVDQQTAGAAPRPTTKDVPEPPPFKVSQGVPSDDNGGVPLPPESHKRPAVSTPVAQYQLPQEVTRI